MTDDNTRSCKKSQSFLKITSSDRFGAKQVTLCLGEGGHGPYTPAIRQQWCRLGDADRQDMGRPFSVPF